MCVLSSHAGVVSVASITHSPLDVLENDFRMAHPVCSDGGKKDVHDLDARLVVTVASEIVRKS